MNADQLHGKKSKNKEKKNTIYVNETVNFMKFDDAMVKIIFREHK